MADKTRIRRQIRRLKCKDRVEIKWLDACAPRENGWVDEPGLEEWLKDDFPIMEIGYVIECDKKYLSIIGGYSAAEEYYTLHHRELKIPIGCIVKIRKLK